MVVSIASDHAGYELRQKVRKYLEEKGFEVLDGGAPNGTDSYSYVDAGIKGLSEGQAQRISIARALLRNAPILLLDEATSALDRETEERVLNNIMSSHPDRLIILSTHRPAALRLCNRIYKISGGKISETTLEDALEMQSIIAEPKASDMQGVNYVKLIKPMGPQENDPENGNTEEGWWNT